MSRQELFRFEESNAVGEQWIIRTWDGSHLSVNEDGNLTVQVTLYSHVYFHVTAICVLSIE